MTRRFHHPLWTHLPALTLVGLMIACVVWLWPLSDRLVYRVNGDGSVQKWVNTWQLLGPIGLSLFMIGLSFFGDEMWARYEKQKTWSFLACFDEFVVPWFAADVFQTTLVLKGWMRVPDPSGDWPPLGWSGVLLLSVAAVGAAAVLEYWRPFNPLREPLHAEDTTAIQEQVRQDHAAGRRWSYWESQNPGYLRWLVPVTMLVLAVSIVGVIHMGAWFVVPIIVVAMAVALALVGGLKVTVSEAGLRLVMGIFGLPLLRLDRRRIAEVAVQEFSPLADFGGWGIRWNRKMYGFFFHGHRGVCIRTREGKQYLIGSDHPERLAAVLQALQAVGAEG